MTLEPPIPGTGGSAAERGGVGYVALVEIDVVLRQIGGVDDRAGLSEVQSDVQVEFLAATAAQSCLNVARVGCPRRRLHRILRLPGAL